MAEIMLTRAVEIFEHLGATYLASQANAARARYGPPVRWAAFVTDSLLRALPRSACLDHTRSSARNGAAAESATVFLAIDRKHRRRVALKFLLDNLQEAARHRPLCTRSR
jgi:hypothetical protein